MFVHLLSKHERIRKLDWTIGGRFYSAITTEKTELLRENIGPDQVHWKVSQGEEGMGIYPAVSVIDGQPDALLSIQAGRGICGEYKNCRWHLENRSS